MQWKPSRCLLTQQTTIHHLTYDCTVAHSHSTAHWTGTFYCLLPAVCSLHHRCRSLQSCRLYWRDCVGHLWEYQDHHSQELRRIKSKSRWTNGWNGTDLLHICPIDMRLILTCFTLYSRPPHITSASVRSCAGPSILTGTDGCTGM